MKITIVAATKIASSTSPLKLKGANEKNWPKKILPNTTPAVQTVSIAARKALIGRDNLITRSIHEIAVVYTQIVENSGVGNVMNLHTIAALIIFVTTQITAGNALAIILNVKLPLIMFLLGCKASIKDGIPTVKAPIKVS